MPFFDDVVDMIDARPEFREELQNAVRLALLGGKLETIDEIRRFLEACSRDHMLRRRFSYEVETVAQRHGWDLGLWPLIEVPIEDDELELIAGGDQILHVKVGGVEDIEQTR